VRNGLRGESQDQLELGIAKEMLLQLQNHKPICRAIALLTPVKRRALDFRTVDK